MKTLDWYGCYGEGWQNEIVGEAFSHPAKFSRALIRRIYEHAIERGWLAEGDEVLDPFAGVALGAVDALALGLNWVGSELEQHFTDMGRGCECTGISKGDWRRCFGRWKRFAHRDGRHWCPRCLAEVERVIEDWEPTLPGLEGQTASYKRNSGQIPHTEPHHYTGNLELFARFSKNGARAVLLQGDSRELAAVLDGAWAMACISSPPYIQSNVGNDDAENELRRLQEKAAAGQLKGEHLRLALQGRLSPHEQAAQAGYGTNPSNLGNMPTGDVDAVISSPPYSGNRFDGGEESLKKKQGFHRGYSADGGYADNTDGQLAAMPEGAFEATAVVSSPPWERQIASHDDFVAPHDTTELMKVNYNTAYGDSSGQLGNTQGDTFWSAARTILEQCYQVLAPGGVAIWVLKSFVRNKAIVDFPDQWRQMCEVCGFETVEWIRAWLVEDRGAQYALNGDLVEKRVHRKSFFRRLHEKKYPDLSIDFEVVLVMRKAEAI